MKFLLILMLAAGGCLAAGLLASPATAAARPTCNTISFTCTEINDGLTDTSGTEYTGHDEPSVLFYSNTPGSGNDNTYQIILPKDSIQLPNPAGTGGTWNFQLHPAFWVGMALCDSQSSPEYTHQECVPDSDTNIADGIDPSAPDYLGKHLGTAFMEMQFYPPGWVSWPPGVSCSATKWCAALNIDSLSRNENTLQLNNTDCRARVGDEPVNFAFITTNGVAHAPAGPLDNGFDTSQPALIPDPATDLSMNPGDRLLVRIHDTPDGVRVDIFDLTTFRHGSMTATPDNGFAQVVFDPSAAQCSERPYSFHPMYATSSEHTRVVWAAHTYNVAYSDEIGHWEYCNQADADGNCTSAGVSETDGLIDDDDFGCFNPSDSLLIPLGGCLGTDDDFDGVAYQNAWPGTNPNITADAIKHSQPVEFTSPTFNGGQNFDRVAFETDLPAIEGAFGQCDNRGTGAGCVNPPPGANFYPFFSTLRLRTIGCIWGEGGPYLRGATNTFGGSSTAEFGDKFKQSLARPGGPQFRYENYRQILTTNPCPS